MLKFIFQVCTNVCNQVIKTFILIFLSVSINGFACFFFWLNNRFRVFLTLKVENVLKGFISLTF